LFARARLAGFGRCPRLGWRRCVARADVVRRAAQVEIDRAAGRIVEDRDRAARSVVGRAPDRQRDRLQRPGREAPMTVERGVGRNEQESVIVAALQWKLECRYFYPGINRLSISSG
jgi:hypothetical protein